MEQKALLTVSEVAKWFLIRSKSELRSETTIYSPITQLKLQKLMYYAQGISLALHDEPLFSIDIKHWQHGPVVPVLYTEYKKFKNKDLEFTVKDEEIIIITEKVNTQEDVHNVLENTYLNFAQYTPSKLRNMTHDESPWKNTKMNEIITQPNIKKYFLEEILN